MEAGSAINAPHPDDGGEEKEDAAAKFFEEDDDTGAEAAGETKSEDAPEAEDEPAADPTPGEPAESGGQTEPPKPDPTTPPASDANDKTRGAAEREYIVFQKLALTEKVLKGLLAEIEAGKTGGPRVVYVELHRAVTRNDRQAIGEGFKANRKDLGDQCELAAVSSRSFKERKVQPRERQPADDIQIV